MAGVVLKPSQIDIGGLKRRRCLDRQQPEAIGCAGGAVSCLENWAELVASNQLFEAIATHGRADDPLECGVFKHRSAPLSVGPRLRKRRSTPPPLTPARVSPRP